MKIKDCYECQYNHWGLELEWVLSASTQTIRNTIQNNTNRVRKGLSTIL